MLDSSAFSEIDGIGEDCVSDILRLARPMTYSCVYIGNRASYEIQDSRTPAHLRRLAANLIYVATSASADTPPEANLRSEIRRHFAGNARSGKHNVDADILFDALKYQCDFVVTGDKRFAGKVQTFPNTRITPLAPRDFASALRSGVWL